MRKKMKGQTITLADQLRDARLLPTPTRHLSKEGAYPAEYTRNTPTLTAHVVGGGTGFLNGSFTEWLMGFPKGHTTSETE
jgi:hypothetical protein